MLTVIPLPEGGGGPSRFPSDLRRGPVHPARSRPGVACGPGAEAREGSPKRPDVEAVTRRPKSYASGFEFEPLRGAGFSGCTTISRQRQAHVGALRGGPQGARRSALAEASWCLGVTAEAGRVETCLGGHCRSRPDPRPSEISGAFDESRLPSSSRFQHRTNSAFRSPEGSHEARQAALPIAASAWEAHWATGYV